MKLGIVVVYRVEERDEALLELHLERIARHTTAPYAIYGDARRLPSPFRARLERDPRVRLPEGPATDLRGAAEHAFHLDHLIGHALGDGASHVAILHVDSFPVRSGWAEELAARLSPRCALAGVLRHRAFDQKPSTICLFFPRDFHLRYRPRFIIPVGERRRARYREYCRTYELIEDSGSGYGFELFRAGLSWHPMTDTSGGEERNGIAAVYDDAIFHLGGAFRHGERSAAGPRSRRPGPASLQSLKQRLRPFVPRPVRRYLSRHPGALPLLDAINRRDFERMRERLLEDPDRLLAELRAGGRA